MIIKITNLVQEALVNHDLNYELSGDEQSKNLLIPTADATLCVNGRESDVYVSGMYKQRIPSNQGSRLRVLCKEVSNIASYSYSITSGRVMCIKRISLDEIINDSDVVYRELVGISRQRKLFSVKSLSLVQSSFAVYVKQQRDSEAETRLPAAPQPRVEASPGKCKTYR